MKGSMTKKWYRSKTVWFNVLTAGAALGTAVVSQNIVTNPVALKVVLLGVAIVNITLRFVTYKGIDTGST